MRHLLIGLWLAGTLTPVPPPAQEKLGEIAGTVRFEGKHKPWKLNDQIDADKHGGPGRDGKDVFDETVVLGPANELANVFVRVKSDVAGKFEIPKAPAEIEMRAYFFRPRVSGVRVGQTLRVKNGDLNNLNVHGKAVRNSEFNVGMVKGSSQDISFKEPETGIYVQHDCCPWQSAWIHVLDHPFFAVTGKDGTFRIGSLPAGTYELDAWHERFGMRTATVTVDGKTAGVWDVVFKGK